MAKLPKQIYFKTYKSNNKILFFVICCTIILSSCLRKTSRENTEKKQDSLQHVVKPIVEEKKVPERKFILEKELLYDKYTLKDTIPYKDTFRVFQWTKIRKGLRLIDSIHLNPSRWGILQNLKNLNGQAPLVKNYHKDEYNRVVDTLGIQRYQSVPLYSVNDTITPERYGMDGFWVKVQDSIGRFTKIETIYFEGEWLVPTKYVKTIADTVVLKKIVFVDRANQNIATIERNDTAWLVRSMNPATTGRYNPPYQQPTPLGIFILQEKKRKMFYYDDGTTDIAGYAPYANRFSGGGYVHGIPVNGIDKKEKEYSPSLGTTPRSHMCVRNATSHAEFVYNWGPVNETIIFVIE